MVDSEYELEGRRTPIELDPNEFRAIGHQLVDDLAGLLETVRERPLAHGWRALD